MLPQGTFKIQDPSMAENSLEILQISHFCESFIVWNGYVRTEDQRLLEGV